MPNQGVVTDGHSYLPVRGQQARRQKRLVICVQPIQLAQQGQQLAFLQAQEVGFEVGPGGGGGRGTPFR